MIELSDFVAPACSPPIFDMMDNSKQVPRKDHGRILLDRSDWMSPTSCREGRIPWSISGSARRFRSTELLAMNRWVLPLEEKEGMAGIRDTCLPSSRKRFFLVGGQVFVCKSSRKTILLFAIQVTPNGSEIHRSACGFKPCPQDGMEECVGRGGSPLQGTAWL